jgi:pyruvate/2-oxoglutarate dehydrogenase complex dihydrolipoamide dehydrogenase (E3) component
MTRQTEKPHATHFDFIVIGGGSGGYAAARTARETCERVAIVDAAPELGGLCILRGCMPSKTLIYSAEVLHHARHGADLGLHIPSARADMPALHRRKVEIIREFAEYRQHQLQSERFTLFRNRAVFVSPDEIELDDGTRLTADHFLIATGSVVATPPVPGLDGLPCWTSDDVLDLDFIPEHVIVLGGGVVACELGQFLRRIGAKVTQIQRSSHLLKEFSPESSATIEARFRSEGIRLHTGTHIESVSHQNGCFEVVFTENGVSKNVSAPFLLNALGRRPATAGLGLDAAGVDLRDNGPIRCSPFQQTSNPRIYAAGDCCGPHEIVHIAILQAETAARHATGRPASPVNQDHLVTVVFTDPQVAMVGLSREEIRCRGIAPVSATYPFADHGKSILMEARDGHVTIHADPDTGRLLGAECAGRDAGELIHSIAVGLTLGATAGDLLKVQWYHPTLSEIWTYPLEEIAEDIAEAQ